MENNKPFNCSEDDYNDYKEFFEKIIEMDKLITDYAGQIGENMEWTLQENYKIEQKHLKKNGKKCDCEERWQKEHPPVVEDVPFGRNFGRGENKGGKRRKRTHRRRSNRKKSHRRKTKKKKN